MEFCLKTLVKAGRRRVPSRDVTTKTKVFTAVLWAQFAIVYTSGNVLEEDIAKRNNIGKEYVVRFSYRIS